jgi:hypothetical protein
MKQDQIQYIVLVMYVYTKLHSLVWTRSHASARASDVPVPVQGNLK